MLIHRLAQQPTRRLFTAPPLSSKSLLPPILSQTACLQKRHAAFAPSKTPSQSTTPASTNTAYDILAKQRLNRPISPHLSIYRPQVTWYLSALNRVTGCTVSGAFYLFGFSYLVSPLFGWHLESAHLAEIVGGWSQWVKIPVKFTVAMPFVFHSLNGVRHLVWDTGREFGNVQVMRTGWAVVGLTVLGSGILAYI